MRTVATISRGPVTDRLLVELRELGLPVGDNSTPDDPYGWQGEPDNEMSNFIPWLTLSASTAQPGTGPVGMSSADWRMPYTVQFAAINRNQLDWMADTTRSKLANLERESVATDSGNWKFQQVRCTSVGGSNRIASTFPDYFTQADLFEVWLTKERS